jgi:energy-coupling factor transport system permease protein
MASAAPGASDIAASGAQRLRPQASAPALPRTTPKRRAEPRRRGLARRQPAAIAAYVGALILAAIVLVNPLQVTALLLLCLVVLWGAGRGRAAWPYLKTALFIGGFLALLNPLISHGGSTVLWQFALGPLTVSITLQGIVYGVTTALRIIAVITAFALFTLVLDPDDQLGLMSRLSFRTGLVLSLACRLLPVFSRDAARISDAQRARGVELDAGPRRARVTARAPLLAALLSQSLERAVDIAASMEARGFGARGRTRWSHGRRWRTGDVVTTTVAAVAAAALVVGLVGGAFSYNFYPLLDDPLAQLTSTVSVLTLLALALPAIWTLPWRRSRN